MKRNRVLVAACSLGVLGAIAGSVLLYAAGVPKDARYVGANKCMACHMKEYKSWQKTKHATVFAQLQGDEVKKADCVKCHTTAYGQPGGFTSVEQTPNLENVQCEACHGQGSAHIEAAKSAPESGDWDKKINKVPQNVCVDCHNPHINRKELAEKSRAEQKK